MGQTWSDILYYDNPKRREQVAELANKLRSNVEQVYTTCVTLSLVVHTMCQDYNIVPPIDLTKTYNENFDVLKATFEQWAKITEHRTGGEKVTKDTRKLIDDINSATDAKAFSEHVDKAIAKVSDAAFWSRFTIGLIAGALASKFAFMMIVPAVGAGVVRTALGVIGGALAGAAAAVLVDIIIAAIDGARERGELEARKAELQEAIDKLAPEVSNLQKEVTGVMVKIVALQSKVKT